MKVIKKNVYYCDHCNKRGLSGGHMRNHEAGCTANPNRVCRLCGGGSIAHVIADFKTRFMLGETIVSGEFPDDEVPQTVARWTGEPVTLSEIRDKADNCPNCILAILRQVGFNRYYFNLGKFDYKEESAKYWAERKPDPADYYRY